MTGESETFHKGLENRKKVLGGAHVEKSWASADDFNRPVQRMVTEVCWGEIWGDETLDFRTRSMINIAMLAAMSQHHELGVHVKGALTNGVTREEIRAVLMQTFVYCGAPVGLAAFRTASAALREWDEAQAAKAASAPAQPSPGAGSPSMDIDTDKIDDTVLALLQLTLHDGCYAWKNFDRDVTDRLHQKDMIENPANKTKSLVLTDEGLRRSEELFRALFTGIS
jgi:4-carboxymuconolactone decarboxylase